MKIAFISGRDSREKNDTDGATVLVHHLANYLALRGHTIDIYTPKQYKGGNYREETSLDDILDEPPLSSHVRFIKFQTPQIVDLPATDSPEQYFLNRILVGEKEADFFAHEKVLYQYDCIYIFHIAHIFGLISKQLIPLERTVLFSMMLGAFYARFMPVPNEYTEKEREALAKVRHISSPSSAEIDVLKNEYSVDECRIFKTLRGLDQKIFIPTERTRIDKTKPIRILCANNIRPQKCQLFFVELVQYAKRHGRRLEIHLVGTNGKTHNDWYNEYATVLMREIIEKDIEQSFCFYGTVTQKNLFNIMKRCDIAFYPSITETFGKSPIESIANGLPTIVFDDVPAFKEYINDHVTGLRVPRTTASAYQAINELCENTELYALLSKNGIKNTQCFTWQHIFDQMIMEQRKRGFIGL